MASSNVCPYLKQTNNKGFSEAPRAGTFPLVGNRFLRVLAQAVVHLPEVVSVLLIFLLGKNGQRNILLLHLTGVQSNLNIGVIEHGSVVGQQNLKVKIIASSVLNGESIHTYSSVFKGGKPWPLDHIHLCKYNILLLLSWYLVCAPFELKQQLH